MPERTGVTVRDGETVGACLIEVRVDGAVVALTTVHWALAPAELVELLREFTARHADEFRASQAAVPPEGDPQSFRPWGGFRLIS